MSDWTSWTETASIREADWSVGPIPDDLRDRRVEITGPTDRKMVVNALNSGARVFMADFEDSSTPTWDNGIEGQLNLKDAVNRRIDFTSREGKRYELGQDTATLIVRPRGWHLEEKHVLIDGCPMSGSLFDFGLFFFHNATQLIEAGKGPYFYLPKLESHLEARLWNDVFDWSQDRLGILRGTIKATVLIETLPAVFEMDEILYELRRHIVGLNCGRWDYIFSFIKCFHARPELRTTGSQPGDDGGTLPACLLAAADTDLSPPGRVRHGRYGRADTDQIRSRGQRGCSVKSAGRQRARSARRARWNLGCTSRARSRGHESVRSTP